MTWVLKTTDNPYNMMIEIVVCAVPVNTVVDAVRSALYTGNYGDGKLFIYPIENVVKVRTGEQGYDALQNYDEETAPAK